MESAVLLQACAFNGSFRIGPHTSILSEGEMADVRILPIIQMSCTGGWRKWLSKELGPCAWDTGGPD